MCDSLLLRLRVGEREPERLPEPVVPVEPMGQRGQPFSKAGCRQLRSSAQWLRISGPEPDAQRGRWRVRWRAVDGPHGAELL